MPSLIDIRRRVRSVKNTQQITKAMKMVAAARLRRAQERVLAARPYAAMLEQVLGNVSGAALGDEKAAQNPLLAVRPEQRIQLVLVTADRGLAGAFNSNLVRAAQKFVDDHAAARVSVEAIGRKGRDYFRNRKVPLTGEHLGLVMKATPADAGRIGDTLAARYAAGETDAVYLIYNEFKSVIAQKLVVSRLLPVSLEGREATLDYIYEQPPDELLNSLLPKYVETSLYRAMIESAAAEHAARMTAMDSATSNATDVIESLTLYMNRIRQAKITNEIIEVVSGASALE
ncbi:MAG: ATP synthase F1 subunit gamma [Acidobacteria bacterium]|nr:ATP synthase F1 subunit gamma [Acidobacteriota bacterium]